MEENWIVDEFYSLRVEFAGFGTDITQRKPELEISYVGCKVIEGNRQPLCLRIRLAVSLQTGIWSSHSKLFHAIVARHDQREQGGFVS